MSASRVPGHSAASIVAPRSILRDRHWSLCSRQCSGNHRKAAQDEQYERAFGASSAMDGSWWGVSVCDFSPGPYVVTSSLSLCAWGTAWNYAHVCRKAVRDVRPTHIHDSLGCSASEALALHTATADVDCPLGAMIRASRMLSVGGDDSARDMRSLAPSKTSMESRLYKITLHTSPLLLHVLFSLTSVVLHFHCSSCCRYDLRRGKHAGSVLPVSFINYSRQRREGMERMGHGKHHITECTCSDVVEWAAFPRLLSRNGLPSYSNEDQNIRRFGSSTRHRLFKHHCLST